MNRRLSSLIQAVVFVLLLVGIFYSVSDACTFVGIVRDPAHDYHFTDVDGGMARALMNYMPTTAARDQRTDGTAEAGWAMFRYDFDPDHPENLPSIVDPDQADGLIPWTRYSGPTGARPSTPYADRNVEPALPSADYNTDRAAAINGTHDTDATLVISHMRKSSYHSDLNSPHPFIYNHIFGRSYAFIHNGTLQVFGYYHNGSFREGMRNRMDVGFCGLDIFHNRPYAAWQHTWSIDSEHYAMLVMKYLLVQHNYYWAGPSTSPPWVGAQPEEWAIQKVEEGWYGANWFDNNTATNSSLNGILTDGSTMWVIAKADNEFPHTVGIRDETGTDCHCYQIASAICQGDNDTNCDDTFEPLDHTGPGMTVRVTGTAAPVGHAMTETPMDLPDELRINSADHSEFDQTEPVISTASNGAWVVVWVSHGNIVGRWYDQMGLAESDEFLISDPANTDYKGHPAVALSQAGTRMTATWEQQGPDLYWSRQLMKRSFTWSSSLRIWQPDNDEQVVCTNSCDVVFAQPEYLHSSIAYSIQTNDNNYAIVWDYFVCDPLRREIRAQVYDVDGNLVGGELMINPEYSVVEPDIAYIGNGVFGISYHGAADEQNAYVSLLRETTPPVINGLLTLSQGGGHTSIARRFGTLTNREFFVSYNNSGAIRVDRCQVRTDFSGADLLSSYDGEEVYYHYIRPQVASRENDGTCYVCYEKDGLEGRDIYCARLSGTQFIVEPTPGSPAPVNLHHANDQTAPVMAIAQSYSTFYTTNSVSDVFTARRMIVWQTYGQDDPDDASWGIAGQFRGITSNNLAPWSTDDNFATGGLALGGMIGQFLTITEPVVYMTENVNVAPGVTLTFGPGVTVYAAAGCTLRVAGTLVADYCHFTALDPSGIGTRWSGIFVTGNGSLTGCTIDRAATGITELEANGLTLDGCLIEHNGAGIYIYEPKNSAPVITNCTIINNDAEGIHLFSTYKAEISSCPDISGNGADGILLTDSYAIINGNRFRANNGYGLDGYGSSPTLFCNNFEEDTKGEMYLVNGSYPVLWNNNGVTAGSNTFVNTGHTLITMLDSYPVCAKGGNQFSIYGSGGFYMADLAGSLSQPHDVSGNSWYPDNPPKIADFSPADTKVWLFNQTGSFGGCSAPKGASGNASQTLFEQGYTAEMAGNTADASTAYRQTISQYPDSLWAQVAASRLLNNQMQVNSGYSDLQSYYGTVQTAHTEDTCLVETAQDLATRTLVEDHQYASAMSTYQRIMANPPTDVDSAYAALDYAVTLLRLEYDSLHSGLDSELPAVSAQTIQSLRQALQHVIPTVPEAHHEDYLKQPETCKLEQNYPNPFNATTTLRYAVPNSGLVRLSVYNIVGQKVATLVDGHQDAGYHTVSWNGTNLASGVYIYRLQASGQTLTHKMLLLK